ncbi:MAG: hypothetical protein IKW81_04500, partial [Pseudobutyrivibrio sp.]|nr:hypothetical protein [Pseudobutyrivibrio sp.]
SKKTILKIADYAALAEEHKKLEEQYKLEKLKHTDYSDIEKIFKPSLNIEGVNSFNILKSNSDKDNRYDIMIKMDLSEQGLLNFDSSEVHSLWKSEFGDLIFNKVIFDCE